MPDQARIQTDQQLTKMEKEIRKIYLRSYKDISKDWDAYMASHAPKLEKAKADLDEALKSGDKQAITKARDVYERTAKNITVNNKRFKDMREETCAKLSNLNETALNYINSNMPKIYTMNYNEFGQTEKIAGYSFALINENAVKSLANTGDLSLYRHVDVSKDMAWNEKFINSQVTQGILQGESISKISDRIFPELMRKSDLTGLTGKQVEGIIKRNINSSVRIARTMTTAAENKGRQDSFKKAQDDGVIMTRKWVAAIDERTRAWHAELNGVEVGVDEPWENDYGEIMYPGDPTADAANVYNCRCAIRAHVKGFAWSQPLKGESMTAKNTPQNTGNISGNVIGNIFKMSPEDRADLLGITDGNWPNIGDDVKSMIYERTNELNNKYPYMRQYFKASHTEFAEIDDANIIMSAAPSRQSQTYYFKVSKNNASTTSQLKSGTIADIATKNAMPCANNMLDKYDFTHEYGHSLCNYILQARRPIKVTSQMTNEEIEILRGRKQAKIQKEILKIANKNNRDYKSDLSIYSMTSPSEFFAEAFANMECGKPNSIGKALQIWLKKEGLI